MDQTEYRIDYTITRRRPGENDFTEIGFGSSNAWSSLDQCAHMVNSAVQNKDWETSAGMPDPADVETDGEDDRLTYPIFSTAHDKQMVLDRVPVAPGDECHA